MKKIIRLSLRNFATILLLGWLVGRRFLLGIVPEYVLQESFFVIFLLWLFVLKYQNKFPSKVFLYFSLAIISLGGITRFIGSTQASEIILRTGYAVFLYGSVLAVIETIQRSRHA